MDQFRPREDPNPVWELQKGLDDVKNMFNRFLGGMGTWIVVIVLAALYLSSGFYIVGPGEKGVVLLFGKVHTISEPGLRYRLPKPFMTHMIVDVSRVRRAEIGFRSDGNRTRPVAAESLMLTGDENIVDVQLFIQYMVQDPVKFLFGCDMPEKTLQQSAEVALRGAVGENSIDHTMTTGRMEVQKRVEVALQRLLDLYNTGLLATQARLLVVDPPAQVQEAFHDVVRAWEDRERLIKEAEGFQEDIIPKARGQAQQEIQQAEGYKGQRVIRAKGDAERFNRILIEYSKYPNVTRERLYLEGVEQFLPPTKKFVVESSSGGVVPLLPLMDRIGVPTPERPKVAEPEQPAPKKGR
jgi:modulator of FtsH protease HflK